MAIQPSGRIGNALSSIERIGNRLPHPTSLFIIFSVLTLVLSFIFYATGYTSVHPVTGVEITVKNLLSQEGLHLILTKTVTNFTHFAPVGTVLVAMLGLGIAERSGLLGSLLRLTVLRTPDKLITPMIVLAGVLSSIAADAGYVVLIPLAGMVFQQCGKHPIAGMAAAFAGVSGGFSANLLAGPVDAILSGISTEAAKIVDPSVQLSVLSNYYFIIASTFLITIVASLITDKVIVPQLPYSQPENSNTDAIHYAERQGLKNVFIFSAVFVGLILFCTVPENAIMRDPSTGSLIKSPFVSGVVTLIALWAGLSGIIFGLSSGEFKSDSDIIKSMEDTIAMMAGYIVLMFFAAQFVNYFAWSNIGIISAVKGANFIQEMNVPASLLLAMFIVFIASLNLLVGSASAKWSALAPIFIPMLMLSGIPPEATQAAYRVGDSTTNIITPLMPYFGVVIAYMQKYESDLKIGSVVATMLPYSVALLFSWTAFFAVWYAIGIPFGI